MFDWLGTFTQETFDHFEKYISKTDGAKPSIEERKKHLGSERARLMQFEGLMKAIDSRFEAGSQLRWKEEPHIPKSDELARPARCDQEPGVFISAMKRVWRQFLWHKKDEAAYNWLKSKDRAWQYEDEIEDLVKTKAGWPDWKRRVNLMLSKASLDDKVYRCLLHENDESVSY